MSARRKFSRRTLLVPIVLLALLFLAVPLLLFHEPRVPHVTATFAGIPDSLRPTLANFTISNHSSRLVHFEGYQFVIDSVPHMHQTHTIAPGQSVLVSLSVPEPFAARTHVELLLRRQDTAAEEAREILDSVLSSLHVRLPGLNPDASANRFRITAKIPHRKP